MKNEMMYGGKFIPQGDRMAAATQTPKRKHDYVQPAYARFKLVIEYSNSGKRLYYFSYEFTKENVSEEQAYEELRKRIVNRKNPELYNFITVWMNLTSDLSTKKKNYDFECYTVKAGQNLTTERNPVFFPSGQVNIWETKCKYKLPGTMEVIQDQEKNENDFQMQKLRASTINKMIQDRANHFSKSKFG